MTDTQRNAYERVVLSMGQPDNRTEFAVVWTRGPWKVIMNLWEDGTARVTREKPSTSGIATWESFEPRYMIDVLLGKVV